MADSLIGKNKVVRIVDGEEHVLYEASAEIMTVLQGEELFHRLFRKVDRYVDRLYQALSHTRSEARRTMIALGILKDLWNSMMDIGPYIVPNLLADLEYERAFSPRYRDHTVHQLRVLLLGLYFYCRNTIIREAVRSEMVEILHDNVPCSDDSEICFLRAWLVTALYHDQGYVFELKGRDEGEDRLDRIYEYFNSFFAAPLSAYLGDHFNITFPSVREQRVRSGLRLPQGFQIGSFDDLLLDPDGETCILDEIEGYADRCSLGGRGKPLRMYFEMARNEAAGGRHPYINHGIASAVMLLRSHHELSRYVGSLAENQRNGQLARFVPDNQIREIIELLNATLDEATPSVRHASVAIALHNINPTGWPATVYAERRYDLTLESFRLSFPKTPLATLLYLCDTLQDWDRPQFALVGDEDDYVQIDQHLLISANEHKVGVKFYLSTHDASADTQERFASLVGVLAKVMGTDEVRDILSSDAAITKPELLSLESPEQIADRTRREAQRRYDAIAEKWTAYREAKKKSVLKYEVADEQRACCLRHFEAFLTWCKEQGYEFVKVADYEDLEKLYGEIRIEINDLNYVAIGSLVQGRKVIAQLGAGGYGTVYKVQGLDLNAPVEAFKVFHTNNFAVPELVDRFERGFGSMRNLSHARITKVTSFSMIPRGYFMEFIEGNNLEKFLQTRGSRLAIAEARKKIDLLVDICAIIEYAHSEPVFHRDIKPANIIMRPCGPNAYEPVLTDFDLAWYVQAVALTLSRAELVGSYLYAPPEQKKLREDTDIVHRPTVDVFSLGRLVYFLFTEENPEEDIDMADRLIRVVQRKYPEVQAISFSYQLGQVYRRATRVNYLERYQTVTELKEALKELLRLLGAQTGLFEQRIFFLELALRLNGTSHFEDDAKLSEEGKLLLRLGEGQIMVDSHRPASGRPYLQIQASVSSTALSLTQQRSFRAARETLNRRFEKWIDKSPLKPFLHQPGHSGDVYSYIVRIPIPDFSLPQLEKLEKELKSLRAIFK